MNCDPDQDKIIDRDSTVVIENYPDPQSGAAITVKDYRAFSSNFTSNIQDYN